MSADVAIIGVGLHPFGRFPGKSAHRDGRRRGPRWRWPTPASSGSDVQFAFGGSYEVDNPDAVVDLLGLTGIPFIDVYNGCATAASALTQAAEHDPPRRRTTSASPSAWTSTCPGAFNADPRSTACPSWYGEVGQFLTTEVLRR